MTAYDALQRIGCKLESKSKSCAGYEAAYFGFLKDVVWNLEDHIAEEDFDIGD